MPYNLWKCYEWICDKLMESGNTSNIERKQLALLMMERMNVTTPQKVNNHIQNMIDQGFLETEKDDKKYRVSDREFLRHGKR
ncbi:MAG: hypothetical protein WCK39_00675 [Methanomassiliicoccales archaeon]